MARFVSQTRHAWAAAGAAAASAIGSPLLRRDETPWRPVACKSDGPRLICFGEAMIRYVPDPEPIASSSQPSRFTSRWLQNAGGAELNITVALHNLGWGGRARWVSVLPTGNLGEEVLKLISNAYSDGGKENLSMVRRQDGDVGIYHVWPVEKKIAFQRRNSVFGQMDPTWFDQDFWKETLSYEADTDPFDILEPLVTSPPIILHLTGITPLIGERSHKAWWNALRAAASLKAEAVPKNLIVTFDINHRPALGTFDDLWCLVEPHIGTFDLLVLSVGDVLKIGKILNVPEAANMFTANFVPAGYAGAEALDSVMQVALKALQARLGNRTTLAVCCKQRDPSSGQQGAPPRQLRWSVICMKGGDVLSTFRTKIDQEVLEEIGGGDSWLSGCIDGLVASPVPMANAPNWKKEDFLAAMRRGDMLATLKQRQVGDFSHVLKAELDAAVASHVAKC